MANQLFVVGAPRSGTTMLSRLLKYTKYGAPIETHFIVRLYKKLHSYGGLTDKENVFRLLDDIMRERAIMQRRVILDKEDFYSSLTEFTYSEIIDQFLKIIFQRQGKSCWGDKTPSYICDLDVIYNLFPDAKYIYIVRDGRDVALSLLRVPWGPMNIYACAKYWSEANSHPLLYEMQSSQKLYKIKYEELLIDPDKRIRELYDFLGEKLSDDTLAELADFVNTNNFDKWRLSMTSRQVNSFEYIAGASLKKHGYALASSCSPMPTFMKIIYELHDAILRSFHLIKINTVDSFMIKFFGKDPFSS